MALMEGEGHQGPSQGWRGRHQYGLPKDGGGGTSMASPRMEGKAPVWPSQGWRAPVWLSWKGKAIRGLPKDGGLQWGSH